MTQAQLTAFLKRPSKTKVRSKSPSKKKLSRREAARVAAKARWKKYYSKLPRYSLPQLKEVEAKRPKRARSLDSKRKAKIVLKPTDPRVALWVRRPGRYDVEGIDAPLKNAKTIVVKSRVATKAKKARVRSKKPPAPKNPYLILPPKERGEVLRKIVDAKLLLTKLRAKLEDYKYIRVDGKKKPFKSAIELEKEIKDIEKPLDMYYKSVKKGKIRQRSFERLGAMLAWVKTLPEKFEAIREDAIEAESGLGLY